MYIDDIVITGNGQDSITKLKQHLFKYFHTKDLGRLKYFIGIEVAQSRLNIIMWHCMCALDILEETRMMRCRTIEAPMDPNANILPRQAEPFRDF